MKTQIWEEGECDFEVSLDEWTILEQVLEKRKNQDSVQTVDMIHEDDLRDCLDNYCGKESKAQENLLGNLKKTKLMEEILQNATPLDFAKAGFFYSHPRMKGLQVGDTSLSRKDIVFHILR